MLSRFGYTPLRFCATVHLRYGSGVRPTTIPAIKGSVRCAWRAGTHCLPGCGAAAYAKQEHSLGYTPPHTLHTSPLQLPATCLPATSHLWARLRTWEGRKAHFSPSSSCTAYIHLPLHFIHTLPATHTTPHLHTTHHLHTAYLGLHLGLHWFTVTPGVGKMWPLKRITQHLTRQHLFASPPAGLMCDKVPPAARLPLLDPTSPARYACPRVTTAGGWAACALAPATAATGQAVAPSQFPPGFPLCAYTSPRVCLWTLP